MISLQLYNIITQSSEIKEKVKNKISGRKSLLRIRSVLKIYTFVKYSIYPVYYAQQRVIYFC